MVTEHMAERSLAEKNMSSYFVTHDTAYLTEDAVIISMNTGEETKGREAIGAMLHHIYQVAFDAHSVINKSVIAEDNAFIEAVFTGNHIEEFAGIPATGREVKVPMCVACDLNDTGSIKQARIYMIGDVLMRQLTA